MLKLRETQLRAKKLVYTAFRDNTRVILQKPTGAGKTYTAASIALDSINCGRRVLFLVDQTNLIEQTLSAMRDLIDIPIGVVWRNHPETYYDRKLQLCMAQTMSNRLESGKWECNPDEKLLIIVDEAHVQYAVIQLLSELYPNALFLGLSATPFSKGMGRFWQAKVIGATYTELLEDGKLAPLRVFSSAEIDLTGLAQNSDGDVSDAAASKVLRETLAGEMVAQWKQHSEGRKSLYFCPRVRDAEFIADKFKAAGIPAAAINGYSGGPEKVALDAEMLAKFASGEIKILVNVEKMVKGTDIPDIGCIGLCRVSRSLKYHLQAVGRGMRVCDLYPDCIVIDHAGNFHRNGWPQDIDHMEFELNTDEKTTQDRNDLPPDERVRTCKCGASIAAGDKVCLHCGHKPKSPVKIKWDAQIELAELTRAQAIRARGGVDEAMLFYQHLLWFSENKVTVKDKDAWIKRHFKRRHGVSANVFASFRLKPEVPDDVANAWYANVQNAKFYGAKKWKR